MKKAIVLSPAKSALELENEALRSRVSKLEQKLIALNQWVRWLRGHVAAASTLFEGDTIEEHVNPDNLKGQTRKKLR
jgi:hypothetical protein